MEFLRCFSLSLLAAALIFGSTSLSAQDTNSLTINSPVDGQIGNGSSQTWTFNAVEGEVLSFAVHTTGGNLDPKFTISNSKGEPFLSNDDFAYPDNQDALLEAVTMARTDTYSLTVNGVGTTSGEYQLTMLNGFSQIGLSDNFNGDLQWTSATAPTSDFNVSSDNGQIGLALTGPNHTGIATNPKQSVTSDFYAAVNVTASGGQDGWIVGMTLREIDPSNYYLLNLNSRGQWRLSVRQDGVDKVIRDWLNHPALANSSGNFTLGVMVDGTGFDFFYNNVLFGRLSDSTFTAPGVIGLAVGTSSSLSSQTTAYFDDLIVSVPTLKNGQRIIPQQIALGQPTVLTRDLQRRGLIPANGQLVLNVAESSIESARPGVDRIALARGATYTDFAIGTTVSWQAAGEGISGCGIVLQAKDDTNYTLAYVDHSGALGVSQRQSDHFIPGIFAENTTITGNKHSLVVILQKEQLLYYVDGFYSGRMANSGINGGIGNAVVNFDPIRTSCNFTDTWVWNWDN
ncbi:MAG: hypothetical protein GC179_07705 [Anaerolineaceae bacterium]|nr:hypothetical protein [Anaerolineaceae bacterium]